jgi:glycosyltransferase involved in cell wall biosynthesis
MRLRTRAGARLASAAPRLLLILPGPLWEIKGSLRKRIEYLSERYQGLIVTTMPEAGRHRLGNFTLKSLRFHRGLKTWVNLKYLMYGCWLALRARLGGPGWDLVVTYDPLRSGLIGLLVARLAGARFCPEVNGVYNSYANYIDDPPGPMLRLKKWLYPRLVSFTLSHADGIKILFPRQLDAFRRVLRNPVVESFFDYVDLEPFRDLGEEKVILFVGFPFRLKGVDLLIEAFKKIHPRHPEWKLKILGWFPDDRALKKAMDGHPAIFHHPPVYSSEMPAHMGSCGIFVLPSRTEAMGRVLLEAMASGKPRVGSRLEGIPTVIDDGVDGLLFHPGDADDLAAKLDRLMGDADLRRTLGRAGRARALREFGADAYFPRLLGFYGKVLRREAEAVPDPVRGMEGILDAAS